MDRRSLTYRVLTAVVGIPLLLGAAWLGGWWWAATTAGLVFLAAVEYFHLNPGFSSPWRMLMLVVVIALLAFRWIVAWFSDGVLFAAIITVWTVQLYVNMILPTVLTGSLSQRWGDVTRPSNIAGVGYLYIGIPAAVLIKWGFDAPFAVILWFFAVIWINDIAAYFGGYAMGRRKLSPQLSPGKTWEGAIAGLVAGTAASSFMAPLLGVSAVRAAIIGLLVTVAAQTGDLFESALKRHAGVKDSGIIFPGHGGVLDRFDGVFAAAPVAYILIWLFAYGLTR